MEDINQFNNSNLPVNMTINNLGIPSSDKIDLLQQFLNNPTYVSDMESLTEKNERQKQYLYEKFTDEMMMYYYVHKPSHIKEEYNKKEETKKEYIRDLLQFYGMLLSHEEFLKNDVMDFTEGSLLKNVDRRHVRQYQEWLKNDSPLRNGKIGYGIATMARKIVIIKSFLKWLHEVEYIKIPLHTAFLNNEVRMKDRPDRDLSYEEVKALIDYYRNHPLNHALLTLLATSGIRIKEIAQSRWCDLYYDSGIGEYYLRVQGKRDEIRHALIKKLVFERLQALRLRKRLSSHLDSTDETPLFTTNRGKTYDFRDLSKYVTNIIKQTNFDFLKYKQGNVTPHWFRHYFAQEAHRSGAPLLFIQNTLGHKKVTTTEIYLKEIMKKENDAAQYIDEKKY
ncbi:tyrosine-type recombinase/integrase [Bacillus sp. sid0103]|uniref:tyrosine-type recombinase/integrase n=1 Tax=Bacillus sp. sid0103 TaxID=2856337 RepID=UPI001C47BDBE|nr:tyrosine-type recombinase/integrase [Bacillus sp. sid0103]MBV7509706.1 tyrosine-type recombinase/integrase [Bacillus sp. sid0103]